MVGTCELHTRHRYRAVRATDKVRPSGRRTSVAVPSKSAHTGIGPTTVSAEPDATSPGISEHRPVISLHPHLRVVDRLNSILTTPCPCGPRTTMRSESAIAAS